MELNTSKEFLKSSFNIYLPAFSKKSIWKHCYDINPYSDIVGIVYEDFLPFPYIMLRGSLDIESSKIYEEGRDLRDILNTNNPTIIVTEFYNENARLILSANENLFIDLMSKAWQDKYGEYEKYFELEKEERDRILNKTLDNER